MVPGSTTDVSAANTLNDAGRRTNEDLIAPRAGHARPLKRDRVARSIDRLRRRGGRRRNRVRNRRPPRDRATIRRHDAKLIRAAGNQPGAADVEIVDRRDRRGCDSDAPVTAAVSRRSTAVSVRPSGVAIVTTAPVTCRCVGNRAGRRLDDDDLMLHARIEHGVDDERVGVRAHRRRLDAGRRRRRGKHENRRV